MLRYLRAIMNRSGQATVGNHSTGAHHWNQPLQVRGKHPCRVKVKQPCRMLIMQRSWLIFTFITLLVFNHLLVEWLNKGAKKKNHYQLAGWQPRGGSMQDTDIISACHWGWTLLPIPHSLGDIIKTESLYRLFLFCPETCISLQFDTIALNISWLQRVTGMNFSPSPCGVSYLCVPFPAEFQQQDNLKLLAPRPYGVAAVQGIAPRKLDWVT